MKEAKHTAGPWTIQDRGKRSPRALIIASESHSRMQICALFGPYDCQADARLIAAAPELLEELKCARTWIPSSLPYAKTVDALIAKAEGRDAE